PMRRPSKFWKLTAMMIGEEMKLPEAKEAQAYFFYRQVLGILNRTFVPFLMGGGFAFEFSTHLGRSMKDMDIIIRRSDLEKVCEVIYQSERQRIPPEVIRELLHRLAGELTAPVSADQPCLGPLLSRIQYRPDIEKMGFKDARLATNSKMSPDEAVEWTDAGEEPKH